MTDKPTKKYILKPGLHQFAPGSPATHHNDNLTDAEVEWYLERYPHIAALFIPPSPGEREIEKSDKKKKTMKSKTKKNQVQTLNPALGGKGGL